jgi:hypothetical protein
MSQYYRVVFLGNPVNRSNEIVLAWIEPPNYDAGVKLMEHSYIKDNLMKTVEHLISPNGKYYKCRIIWAGDYAEPETEDENLYYSVENKTNIKIIEKYNTDCYYRYIVNHTLKLYVDKENPLNNVVDYYGSIIHPLSLLVSECGSDDFKGNNEILCGLWSRDSISVETSVPYGFIELVPNFYEEK